MSAPLTLPLESWNKLLQLDNGSTFLIHLTARQPLVVIVFDSAGNETAHRSPECNRFNVRALDRSAFRGMIPEGGDVLFFLEQESLFKNTLFCLLPLAGRGLAYWKVRISIRVANVMLRWWCIAAVAPVSFGWLGATCLSNSYWTNDG